MFDDGMQDRTGDASRVDGDDENREREELFLRTEQETTGDGSTIDGENRKAEFV